MFFGALPGSAFAANDYIVPLPRLVFNYGSSSDVKTLTSSDVFFISGSSGSLDFIPGAFYDFCASLGRSAGVFFATNFFFSDLSAIFYISPVSVSSGSISLPVESDNFYFNWVPDFVMCFYDNETFVDFPLHFRSTGSFTVVFSDGTSKTIPFSSEDSIVFSLRKDNRTNLFDVTSDNAFTLTSKDTASLNGSLSHSGGSLIAPVSGQVSGTAQLPDRLKANISTTGGSASVRSTGYNTLLRTQSISGTAFDTDNYLGLSSETSVSSHLFKIYSPKLLINVSDAVISMVDANIRFADTAVAIVGSLVNAKVDSLTVTEAKASAVGTLVAPNSSVKAVETIVPHNPAVTISSFSFQASLTFYVSDGFNRFSSSTTYKSLYPLICFNAYASYGSDIDLVSSILLSVNSLGTYLRYDLPSAIRSLIIPTEEEVKDVVNDAVDDIKNNAGGLGESLIIAENAFNSVSDMLTGSTASGFVLPALDVNINGTVYRLWEDFDFMPYINSEPVQQIMDFVSIFLQALLTLYFVNHLLAMWDALLCGNSYVGMLRYLRFEDEEEIDKSLY